MGERKRGCRDYFQLYPPHTSSETGMRPTSEVVYLVDEDLRVREALFELFSSQEIQHFSFGSAAELSLIHI